MNTNNSLVICESFYSIQGEGPYIGFPAVFLRLAGCNLRCSGFSYIDLSTQEHLGCDTKAVWRRGERHSFEKILEWWEREGWLAKLRNGAHLVITGGEPILQQKNLLPFIQYLDTLLEKKVFIEIETNATIILQQALLDRINHFNASPKLAHSGESKARAYHPKALESLFAAGKVILKFVVAHPTDVEEILRDYLIPFNFDKRKVWLMPEGGTREDIKKKQEWLVAVCKEHLFNFTTRLQVEIWGEVTGV